jgi:hypothetical protein
VLCGLIVTEWKHTNDQPAVTGVAGESSSTKSKLRIKGPQDAALVLDHTVLRDYDKFGKRIGSARPWGPMRGPSA